MGVKQLHLIFSINQTQIHQISSPKSQSYSTLLIDSHVPTIIVYLEKKKNMR